jgi:formylglycine-generating enzyme required for sulfatase activity
MVCLAASPIGCGPVQDGDIDGDIDIDVDREGDIDVDGDGDGDGETNAHEPPCVSRYPGMICIPEGPFIMGSTDLGHLEELEMPEQVVHMSQFHIDRHEVTFGEYRACVNAGVCTPPTAEDPEDTRTTGCRWGQPGLDRYPVACIGWLDAVAFCEWRGAELPTEAQWEKAGRGTDGRTYAWGNEEPSCAYASMGTTTDEWFQHSEYGCGTGMAEPVGSHSPAGDSPYGVQDMVGNVSEFVADWLGPGQADLGADPKGADSAGWKTAKGGSFQVAPASNRSSGWLHLAWRGRGGGPIPDFQLGPSVGFRCAVSE